MKQLPILIVTLLIIILGMSSISHAQCANSTCITPELIAAANHQGPPVVLYDPALTHYEYLFVARGAHGNPAFTNVTVYRQEAPGKVGVIIDYPDGFCTMEGYAYGSLQTPAGIVTECRP